MKKSIAIAAALVVGGAGLALAAAARDTISIVGSSTVYPFSTTVAEQFGKASKFKVPKVESSGTGGGFKLFCSGVGVEHPDITNASRRIKKSEFETCEKNGVKEVVEVKVGYDGIVMASSKKAAPIKLSRKEIFMALAKEVPDPKGGAGMVPNPYKTWQDVNKELPAEKIEVLGPPPTSGTRDAFVEMGMEEGCMGFDSIKALKKSDEKAFKKVCHTIREDGAYIEAGENDNLIVQKLEVNPKAMGIFGFSFLDQNADKLQGASVDGNLPTFDAIAAGKYPLSRPLFFYVKKAHVGSVAGIPEYLAEFTSDKAWGKNGYLAEKGLIPMPDAERTQFAADVKAMKTLTADQLK